MIYLETPLTVDKIKQLHVGDEVDVKVIGIKDGKISLSMKALEPAAEEAAEEE